MFAKRSSCLTDLSRVVDCLPITEQRPAPPLLHNTAEDNCIWHIWKAQSMQPVEFLPALHQPWSRVPRIVSLATWERLQNRPQGVRACESLFLYSLLSKQKSVIIPRIYSQAKGKIPFLPKWKEQCVQLNWDRDYHSFCIVLFTIVYYCWFGCISSHSIRSAWCSLSGLFAWLQMFH